MAEQANKSERLGLTVEEAARLADDLVEHVFSVLEKKHGKPLDEFHIETVDAQIAEVITEDLVDAVSVPVSPDKSL